MGDPPPQKRDIAHENAILLPNLMDGNFSDLQDAFFQEKFQFLDFFSRSERIQMPFNVDHNYDFNHTSTSCW